jgi:hypothetical protein
VFYYLSGRMADEVGHLNQKDRPKSYFEEMAAMAREARA